MQERFGVLTEFDSMSDEDIKIAIEILVDIRVYTKDLFAGTRNSQKTQQKRVNRYCSTYFQIVALKWGLHCILKYRSNF